MKKIYFLLAIAFAALNTNAQITLQDDFESYVLGDLSSQADHWRTWSGTQGGAEDANVVNTFFNSGSQSMEIDGSGITDQLLLIPDSPTSGMYTVQWWMYVPTGKGAYFNMQAANSAGAWTQALMGGNVYFNCDGSTGGSGGVTGVTDCSIFEATFSYLQDFWFKVTCIYNLDDQTWSMSIDDQVQFTDYPFAFGAQVFEELAAINFYSVNGNNEFYIDDITLATGVLSTESFDVASFKVFPNPVSDMLNIKSQEVVNTISVYNVLGKLVHTSTPNTISPTVDMGTFESGIYFVKVTIGNVTKTVKVIR